jgi:cardiolipin synthase
MTFELLVNFEEFWARLRQDMASANDSVLIQTFAFEGDSVGQQLADALLACRANDKRILADSFTRIVLSDKFRFWPTSLLDHDLKDEFEKTGALREKLQSLGVEIRFTNPFGLTPRKVLSRNHKKLIVIDSRLAYVGGINFSEHNAAWHDMMLRIDDADAVAFLADDFEASWNGKNRQSDIQARDLELFTLDGRQNRSAFQRVLDLINAARESIFIESPYITFPFYERLREATRRAVNVQIVTPQQNNWSYFANYARMESARSGIDLRLYQDGMSHLKAMLIDDEYLIAGSSNFDYLSYRIHQELIGVFTDPALIADFKQRVMLPDVARAVTVECRAGALRRQWLNWQTKLIDLAVTALT